MKNVQSVSKQSMDRKRWNKPRLLFPVCSPRSLNRFWLLGIVISLVVLQSCAPSASRKFLEQGQRPESVVRLFQLLDQETASAAVVNLAYAKIEGFPYLRTDRFLAAMKGQLTTLEMEKQWIFALQSLDMKSRRSEILNLPETGLERIRRNWGLDVDAGIDSMMARISAASNTLLNHDLAQPGFVEALKERVKVEDEYATYLRVLGLYPIVAWPVAYFSDDFFDQIREWHQTPKEKLPVHGKLISYHLNGTAKAGAPLLNRLFSPDNRDSFGLPELSIREKRQLVEVFAPIFTQDVVADYDRIGRVVWKNGKVEVDTDTPTVYYYFTNGLLNESPILQINYVIWYQGRLGDNTPWYERGLIDGITFRVSLDQNGLPFMVDTMNNCACSHIFVPDRKKVAEIKEISMEFDALVPSWLDSEYPGKRIRLRVNTGWHQIQNIGTSDDGVTETASYELRPYQDLEALVSGSNQRRSIFDNEGIVFGSERIEPYFFFPMGVPEIGAMRQRGHHAIAMIGRAHFDDPHLFNFYFKLQ